MHVREPLRFPQKCVGMCGDRSGSNHGLYLSKHAMKYVTIDGRSTCARARARSLSLALSGQSVARLDDVAKHPPGKLCHTADYTGMFE